MNSQVLDIGRKDYGKVWDLQKRLVERRSRDEVPDTLILVEHDHVITLGRKTSAENFRPQNIPVYQVERGGDATYHGPGQLVGYPILKLSGHDFPKYLRMLEEMLISTTKAFGVYGDRREGHTGVWVGTKKLASIGVAVSNWVTFHGFALNVNTDLTYFNLIKPCGLDPNTMTSMQKLTGKTFNLSEVKKRLSSDFAEVFGERVEFKTLAGLPAT